MRHLKGLVYFYGEKAGELSRESGFFRFQYDRDYVIAGGAPVSYSLPVKVEPYDSETLHGFFSGLVAEGWLKNLQSRIQRIDDKDEFTLLVENGRDLIGAVTIELPDLH